MSQCFGASRWREDGCRETWSWERSHSILVARFREVVFGSRLQMGAKSHGGSFRRKICFRESCADGEKSECFDDSLIPEDRFRESCVGGRTSHRFDGGSRDSGVGGTRVIGWLALARR